MADLPGPPTISEAQAAAFAADPRIHFSRETNTWRFEDDNGQEMEWDVAKSTWVPVIDDDLIKQQQAAYSVQGVDEETPAAPVLARNSKKRKEVDYTGAGGSEPPPPSSTKRGKRDTNATTAHSKNTAVFVTGLPLDATAEEIVARFSKCGVLMEDDDGDPKVKLYANDHGEFNGQALVVYFKEDSVRLALTLLDEAELRQGEANTRMSVQEAKYDHKNTGSGAGQKRVVDKKKATRRINKMQNKVGEWGVDDGFGPSEDGLADIIKPKSRVVVLKHMFTLPELEEDPSLLLDLKEEVREECEKLGDVTNVVLYDKEPDGVMTVKFRDPISAEACVIKMNGRFFGGQRVEASLFEGKQRFQRSGVHDAHGDEDGAEAEKQRLDEFAKWLMEEGD